MSLSTDDILKLVPADTQSGLEKLFQTVPMYQALTHLVVRGPINPDASTQVRLLTSSNSLPPNVKAGLWLYVDELDASHDYSNNIKNATGSYWHGIMHRREGDFSNSHYWFRMMESQGSHPLIPELGYDPHAFIDEVKEVSKGGKGDIVELIERQQQEWLSLMKWCLS